MSRLTVFLLAVTLIFSAAAVSGCSPGSVEPRVQHIHGIGFSPDGGQLYMATHHGLYATADLGSSWNRTGTDIFDLMGFLVHPDGTLLTSGHPGPRSKWPNPVGVMESSDRGKSWTPIALTGEVDFHYLVNVLDKPDSLYGIMQADERNYQAGLYYSEDRGRNWIEVQTEGYGDGWNAALSLAAYSPDGGGPDRLLMGSHNGMYASEDGGASWRRLQSGLLVTAFVWMPDRSLLRYEAGGAYAGLSISLDQGASWTEVHGLQLGREAGFHLAVHPRRTGTWVAASSGHNLHITEDGGQSWRTVAFSNR